MIIFRDKNTCYSLFLNTLYIFLLISITLLLNNGYYAKSHIVQAMNLKRIAYASKQECPDKVQDDR